MNLDIVAVAPRIVNIRKPSRSKRRGPDSQMGKHSGRVGVVPEKRGVVSNPGTLTSATAGSAYYAYPFGMVQLPIGLVAEMDRCLPGMSTRRRDRCLYLLSLVTSHNQCRKDDGYYRPLMASHLAQVIGKEAGTHIYRDLLDELRECGLIDRAGDGSGTYVTGKQAAATQRAATSKQYRCSWKGWRSAPRASYPLYTLDYSYTPKAANTAPGIIVEDETVPDPAFAYLEECYASCSLDIPAALTLLCIEHKIPVDLAGGDLGPEHFAALSRALYEAPIDTMCPNCGHEHTESPDELACPTGELVCRDCEHSWDPHEAAQKHLSAVWYWVTGMTWFKRDRTSYRVHSPVTSMPGFMRPALRLCGSDRLVSLDLKCSQLMFATSQMIQDGVDKM